MSDRKPAPDKPERMELPPGACPHAEVDVEAIRRVLAANPKEVAERMRAEKASRGKRASA